jgi:hypothetical protein
MTREELEQDDDFAVGEVNETASSGGEVAIEEDMFDLDFGGDDEEEAPVEETPEEEVATLDEEPEPESEESDEENPEEEEFEDDELEDDEESEEDEEVFTDIVKHLMDKGVVAIDPDKEYEDSEEGFAEIIEDTVRLKEQERLESLSPQARRLLEIEELGGDIKEAFEELYSFDYNNVDINDEDNQELLVTEHLKLQGYDEADIEETVEGLKDLNKLSKHASIAQKYFVSQQEAEREEYVTRLANEREEREAAKQETLREVMSTIDATDNLGVFSNISRQEKEQFKRYLFEKDKDGKTQAERDNSLEAILINEFNKFKGFDYSLIENRAKTKTTVDWRKKSQRITDRTQEARGSGQRRYRKPDTSNGFSLGEID